MLWSSNHYQPWIQSPTVFLVESPVRQQLARQKPALLCGKAQLPGLKQWHWADTAFRNQKSWILNFLKKKNLKPHLHFQYSAPTMSQAHLLSYPQLPSFCIVIQLPQEWRKKPAARKILLPTRGMYSFPHGCCNLCITLPQWRDMTQKSQLQHVSSTAAASCVHTTDLPCALWDNSKKLSLSVREEGATSYAEKGKK